MSQSPPKSEFPVKEFRKILHACGADEPLEPDDSRYYDFTPLRGGRSVVAQMARTLEQFCAKGEYRHQILCGHRGSGKTTELKKLQDWAAKNGFFCVWMDVYDYVGNPEKLEYTDLYLIIAEAVATALPGLGDEFETVRAWFAETLLEDKNTSKSTLTTEAGAEVKSEIPLLGKIFAAFKAKREDGYEHLKTIKEKIKPRADELVRHTNTLLDQARLRLETDHSRGLLLFFDSLDRFVEATVRELLHESVMLRYLACHAVYTMHIRLMYRPDRSFWDIYNGTPRLLPVPALREWNANWNRTVAESAYKDTAVEAMLAALNKRIVVDALFEKSEDARLLVKMSGGSMRELLHLVNIALTWVDVPLDQSPERLSTAAVHAGIAEHRLMLTGGLSREELSRLAKLANKEEDCQDMDEEMMRFLNLRLVMRYEADGKQWNDVHPIVIECEGFQRVRNDGSTIQSA